MDPPDEHYAMRVFGYSIAYLMALFALRSSTTGWRRGCDLPAMLSAPVN